MDANQQMLNLLLRGAFKQTTLKSNWRLGLKITDVSSQALDRN